MIRCFLTVMLLLSCSALAADAPAPRPVDQTTPIGALKTFATATRAADAKALTSCLHASTDLEKKMASAMVDMAVAVARLRLIAIDKFGEAGAKEFDGGVPSEEDVKRFDSAKEQIDGDKAVVTLPGQPVNQMHMVREGALWKIAVGHNIQGLKPEQLEAAIAAVRTDVKLISEMIDEISSGQHKTAPDAAAAMKKKRQDALQKKG